MELNRTRTAHHARLAVALAVAFSALLAGCARPDRQPAEPTPARVPLELPDPLPADARRFAVVSQESLVSVLVYRAGKLAKAGHNHVIASHKLTGAVAFTADVARSAFVLRIPVASLTVDEPELRGGAGEEFAAEVPQSAREATLANMLSAAVLDAARFPEVTIRSQRVDPASGGALAIVQVMVHGEARTLSVPLRYEQKGEELLADGEFAVRQTDLGLTPFSALLGALQVQDEIRIRFRIIARAT